MNPENAKLTRENYAEINDVTRKNSFFSNKSYFKGLSVDEANEKYWNTIKNIKLNEYKKEKLSYINLIKELNDSTQKEALLKSFIRTETIKRINQEFESNRMFYIESQDPEKQLFGKKYEEVLKRDNIDDNCDDLIKEKFMQFKLDKEKIKYYDKNNLLWIRMPHILKKWYKLNPKQNSSFDIPDDWLKEYFLKKAPYYTNTECKIMQERALKNFDNNIKYFNSLNSKDFNTEINNFLINYPTFEVVDDLKKYANISGVYVMILDEYKQLYIGISRCKQGIKGRIQAHWQSIKPLDKLIWGSPEYSILSIDSFRAYDTTRILVEPHPEFGEMVLNENGTPKKRNFLGISCNVRNADEYLASKEFKLIKNAFSQKYLCNRCHGGGRSMENAVASLQGHELCEESKTQLEATKKNLHKLL
ncbi:hypothetical protein [Ruminococcus sp.]|uniref:hypothetical protein n=1 Tax=Ruminococcus sp. TaxID=41978 RepID=UPI0025CBED8E|nr:hypothetical protein [Ruminococcus sp.]